MAWTRRRAQRQGWGGGGCPPAPLPPSVWHPPDTSRASLHPEDQEPLGHPGSVAVAEPEPPRWLLPGQHLRVGTSAFPRCPWRHWEGNNPPPFFLISFFLFITAAPGEAFQGLTPLPASPPQPRCPGTVARTLHHRLPLPRQTEGSVLAVAETDREEQGVQRSGGCMHGRGSAVREQ